VSEEAIAMVMGLEITGRKWQKVTKVSDEANLSSFFKGKEVLDQYQGDFRREMLPEPWNDVYLVIMKYGVYYYYHSLLFNHFHNRELVCIPFFLMHALKDTIMNVREKSKKGANFTIL
jgi:hypothetical protein